MEELVIGVRFKKTGKLHYYDPTNNTFKIGDNVIANTDRGLEMGRVVKVYNKSELQKDTQFDKVIRPASKQDLQLVSENEKKAKEALAFCKEESKKQNLDMKLLSAEYTLDLSKLTIYFVAEDRVDFRDLVKLLASKYKTRIELRQIGPRDEVKAYPNLGMCGKEVCCRTYIQDFSPVTIKMAKEQGLQINMAKLSGSCGKLMCCLRYEEETYKENSKKLPKLGDIVELKEEKKTGKVVSIDILGLKVKLRHGTTKEDESFEIYPVDMLKWNKKGSK